MAEGSTAIGDGRSDVDQDVFCVNCGYNLRGLPTTGDCPECGCPVNVSRREDSLGTAPAPYLGRLRQGALGLTVCVAVSPLLNVFAVIAAIVAMWLLTSPQPGRDEPAVDWRRRVAARLGMAVWVVVMGGSLVAFALAAITGRTVAAPTPWWMYDAALIGAHAALALGLVAAWGYLAIVAERAAAVDLARRLHRLAWAWVIGLSTIAALGLVVNLIQVFVLPHFLYSRTWEWSPAVMMVIAVVWVGGVLVWLWVRTLRVCLQLERMLRGLGGSGEAGA